MTFFYFIPSENSEIDLMAVSEIDSNRGFNNVDAYSALGYCSWLRFHLSASKNDVRRYIIFYFFEGQV